MKPFSFENTVTLVSIHNDSDASHALSSALFHNGLLTLHSDSDGATIDSVAAHGAALANQHGVPLTKLHQCVEEKEHFCRECGLLMTVDENGIANHIDDEGNTLHDEDADHVALLDGLSSHRIPSTFWSELISSFSGYLEDSLEHYLAVPTEIEYESVVFDFEAYFSILGLEKRNLYTGQVV